MLAYRRGRLVCPADAGMPLLMGILNVTPDSFSDGGRHDGDPRAAAEDALALLEEGAALVDIGGESTRPGATPVPAAEEIRRVVPVVAELRRLHGGAVISVDTSKASVARAALDAGADIVNDVSAMGDPGMAAVLAEYGAACILMHHGAPFVEAPPPPSATPSAAVASWLSRRLAEAREATGLPLENFAVDPGVGFGKSLRENLSLMANAGRALMPLGVPLVMAFSRKSCIGAATGVPDASQRLPGTLAGAVLLRRRCHLLRVHDVAATRQALQMAAALEEAAEE